MNLERSLREPKVQVVIACHRVDRPVRRAIESVLACDEAAAIVVAHGIDPSLLDLPESDRVEVLTHHGHQGCPGAPKNLGIRHAVAPYVGILDSDDFYQEGAIESMLGHLENEGHDGVLAPLVDPEKGPQRLPLTLRTAALDAVGDRLFYRTAPLGLFRRQILQDDRYRLREDLTTGEDMQASLRLWTDGLRIAHFPNDPGYVVGNDGGPRVTENIGSTEESMKAIRALIEEGELASLTPEQCDAAVTKILRVHVLRPTERAVKAGMLTGEDLHVTAGVSRALRKLSPRGTEVFPDADQRILGAVAADDLQKVKQAVVARDRASIRQKVLPTKLRFSLAREGNLRTALDGRLAVLTAPCASAEARGKPRLLILSYSDIRSDARVLKQVNLFRDLYDVTTCGYGDAPDGVAEHVEIPKEFMNLRLYGRFITAKQYRLAYWKVDAVRASWNLLRDRKGYFSAILANEIESLPVALRLKPQRGVLSDLHEHYPSMHEENPGWLRRISPYYAWLCKTYLPRASESTTVSAGIADAYQELTGVRPQVVTNATPYVDIEPTDVHSPIRLVHHGAALPDRDLGLLIDAVIAAGADVEMDMYLMFNHPEYVEQLRVKAQGTSIRVLDGVPYSELVDTLNQYDVGFFILAPTTFSYRQALPNKFFDFVQARLGVIVGPSPEMARIVDQYGLGLVTQGFTSEDGARAIKSLTPQKVAQWKDAANAHAYELSAGPQLEVWRQAMERIIDGGLGLSARF